MRVFPRDGDRSWTRAFYYAINRVARRIGYERRPEIEAEALLRMRNVVLYGCSHPELYAGAEKLVGEQK